jgi:hypothetical protein
LNQFRVAGLRHQRDHGRFQSHHADENRRDQRQIAQQEAHVQQHSHGDEEDAQQHLAIGAYGGFHLVTKFGLRQHHAGEKRAERQ